MKLKFSIFLIFAAFFAQAMAQDLSETLRENSMQAVEILEKTARLEASWEAEQSALNSRLAALQTLNKRLEEEIAQLEAQEEKARKASAEMRAAVLKFREFEKGLDAILKKSSAEYLKSAQKEPAKTLLGGAAGLGENFPDAYAKANAAVLARLFALDASKKLSARNIGGEKALAIGICAVLKEKNCAKIGEIFDMLEGRAPHKILDIYIEGDGK
ncbi:MAG: hypothetical protein IKO42_08105 [Opitutales bacterium]|nr:hypothetical protein [Opitutales bacterium]